MSNATVNLEMKGDVNRYLSRHGQNAQSYGAFLSALADSVGGPAMVATFAKSWAASVSSGADAEEEEETNAEEWAAMMQVEKPQWLWDGIAPKGHLTMLAAAQKAGKSTLLRNLISVVSTGGMFLGRAVQKGKTLYIPLEEHPHMVVDDLRVMGCDMSQVVMPIVRRKSLTIDADGTPMVVKEPMLNADMRRLDAIVRRCKPDLIAIDPIIKYAGLADINDYTEVYEKLSPLLQVAMAHNVAVVFVHHEGKTPGSDIGQRSIGSTALPSIVSTTVSMRKRPGDEDDADGYRVLDTEGRRTVNFSKLRVEMDEESRVLHEVGSEPAMKFATNYERFIDAIREMSTEPFTKPDALKSFTGCRLEDVRDFFKKALDDGNLVHVAGRGLRGEPKLYLFRVQAEEYREANAVPTLPGADATE